MTTAYGSPLEGSFTWPRGFGAQRTPTHRHQGIDIVVPGGRKWLAVADGEIENVVVVPSPRFAGYGRVAVLKFRDADGETLRALYAHGKTVSVQTGQRVTRGQELGTVGRSQFRTAEQLGRAGVPVPSGYSRAMDDEGRVARRSGRPMSPHLHFELARHTYPVGSEANVRIDPRAWAELRGLAPRGRRVARRTLPAVTPPAVQPRQGDALRAEIVNRVMLTGIEVARIETALRRPAVDMPMVASLLRDAWRSARNAILAAVRASATASELRELVEGWLATVRGFVERIASASPPAILVAWARAAQERLTAIWAGIQWAAGWVLTNAAMAAGGGVALLLLLALVMGGGQVAGARYAYRKYAR